MAEFNELRSLSFERPRMPLPGITIEPGRPAPLSSFEPSEKVKEGLAQMLLKIEVQKSPSPSPEVLGPNVDETFAAPMPEPPEWIKRNVAERLAQTELAE